MKKVEDIPFLISVRPPGLNALKQFGQDILTAVEQYEQNMKQELEEKDGK